jgi:hypothetical protein
VPPVRVEAFSAMTQQPEPLMDLAELARLVNAGQEIQRVDFKSTFERGGRPDYRAKLSLSAIPMANTRDVGS